MQRTGATKPSTLRQRLMRSACLSMLISASSLGLAAAHAAGAPALPTRGTVAAGSASITGSGSNLQINQSSNRAVIDWSSFSIGQGASVNFANGSGATLNRVLSGGPLSALDGNLTATGSVYLINPAGVIVGKSGVINVGGTFVASTQDIPDAAFLAGGSLDFAGTSQASVINYGRIGALGGDVVLIASQVSNQGQISAPHGAVGMLAGYQVLLKDQADSDGKFAVLVGGSNTSVTNAGAINAAAAELRAEQGNIYALAGNTTGVIRATQVAGSGGEIRLVAPQGAVQVASGAVLDASANGSGGGGHILVDSANTTFAGTALARGGAQGGDGGLVETSGTQVNFIGARIDTTAAKGKTGQWLIDPTNLTIDTSNNTTLSADLATTSETLQTTSSGASGVGTQSTVNTGPNPTLGDINIDAPVSWSSTSTLTLQAYHSIYINAPVTITGAGVNAGKLIMTTNAAATDGDLHFGGGGSVQYTGAGVGGLMSLLTINGVGYTLETSFASLVSDLNSNLSGHYALATTLSAGGTTYTNSPIAQGVFNNTYQGSPLTGVLEGLGNTVTNLTINATDNNDSLEVLTGLVGYVGASGTVRDIGVVGASVKTTDDLTGASDSTGILVGANLGKVTNAWSSGAVTGSNVGGLVGTNSIGGTVSGSHSSASVTALNNNGAIVGGGLVGLNGDNTDEASGAPLATITQSYATGTVVYTTNTNASSVFLGGLLGWNFSGLVSQSFATGAVTLAATTSAAGGLAGRNSDTIIDSYATGAVTASDPSSFAGGLVGQNDYNIVNAYSSGLVSGAATIGASIGYDDSAGAAGGSVAAATPQNIYYDSTVNGALAGVGQNDSVTVGAGPNVVTTGLATSALKVGSPPSGFNTAIAVQTIFNTNLSTRATAWTALNGLYPVLNFMYPHGAIAISGNVFTGYDTGNAGGGLTVALASNGAVQGTAQTNFSGAYVLAADAGQQSEVLLSGGSSHANTYLGTPSTSTTANLYEGYLRLPFASTSLLATLNGLGAAAGTNSGADYFYNANSTPGVLALGANIDIIASGPFTVDTSLNAGAVWLSTTGNLTLSDPINAGINNNVSLSLGGTFSNTVGASAIQVAGTGRWLIYSPAPQAAGSYDNLDSNNTAIWGTAAGAAITATGDRYVFAQPQTLTVTSTSDSKTYGSDATSQIQGDFTISGFHAAVSGAFLADTAATAYAGAPSLSSTGTAANASVAGGPYAITGSLGTLTSPGGYTFSFANTGLLTVNPLAIGATLTGPITKVYDSTTSASLGSGDYTLDGVLAGDASNLGLMASSGVYAGKDVGSNLGVTFTGLSLTGSAASNYTLAISGLNGNVGMITPLALTASLIGTASRTYDGTTSASLGAGNYTLSSPLGSDVVGLVFNTSGTYDTKDVGTGKTVTVTGLSLTGADAIDYTVASSISGAIGTITPLALTASLTGTVSKVYDGTTAANLASGNYSLSGVIAGDTVALNDPTSGTYDTKDVASGKTVTVSGLALSGADAGDYTLASSVSGAIGTITPLALTASLTGAVSKVYDGTTGANLTSGNYSLLGVIAGDAVALNDPASGTYDTKDVGTGKTVTVEGLALSGADAVDYTVASSISGAIGTITRLALTASFTGTISKVYDGTVDATLASGEYNLAGVVSGDTVGLTATTGVYAGKDVGTSKPVTFAGLSLTGADAGDYSLSTTSLAGNVGVITPLALTASLIGTTSKIYDGTTAAALTSGNYSLSGAIGGDAVVLNDPASGTYDTKDVGTGKTVTVGGLALSGADAGDYTVASSVSGAIGTITRLALTASLTGTVSKVYDGTTAAQLTSGNYSLPGVIAGDTVALNSPTSATYDTKDVGTGKTVSVSGLTLSGADANDYSIASSTLSGAIGAITTKALTASLTGTVSKVYDGTTAAANLTSGNYSLSGVVAGDTVTLNDPTSGTYDTKDVASGKTVTVNGLALSGADAGDYTLASSVSGAIGTITPLALTASLTGTVSKVYDGSTTAANLTSGNYSLLGVIAGDAVALNDPASGTYDTKDVGTGKTVTVGGLSLTGAQAGDYTIASSTLSGAVGVITPLALTARLTGTVAKTYDGTVDATLASGNYVLAGLISGDSVALNDPASGVYDTKDAGTGKTVTVGGLALTGAQAGDYTLAGTVSGAVGTITPLALTARLTGTVSKTYDGTTVATLVPGDYVLAGLIAGDSVGLNDPTSGTYDTKDVGTGKTVTVTCLSLTGAQASDYSVGGSVSAPIGTITPLALTARLTGTVSKTYDGTNGATLAAGDYVLAGLVAGDSVALNDPTSGVYDTKDAGTGKTITVSGLSLTGAQAADYTVTGSVSGAIGVITPLALTASLTGTVSKVYDGDTVATLASDNYVLSGLISGDSVALNDPTTGTYDTKDVGTGKTVTVAGVALTGAQAGDYSVAGSLSAAIGVITPKTLIASVSANNKVYDGALVDTGSASLNSGVVPGDQVSVSSGAYSFATAGVGVNKSVAVSGLALSGADAGDYALSFPSSTTADITVRPVTIAANDISKLVSLADPPLTYTLESGSLVSGDQVSGALARAPGEALGNYAIGQGTLALSSNYALTFVDGVFTILPPSTGLSAFAPANGNSFNASNGASSFSTGLTSPGNGPSNGQANGGTPASSGGGQGSAPAAPAVVLLQSSGGGQTNAPYPDNRYVSDNIRFTIGMNP